MFFACHNARNALLAASVVQVLKGLLPVDSLWCRTCNCSEGTGVSFWADLTRRVWEEPAYGENDGISNVFQLQRVVVAHGYDVCSAVVVMVDIVVVVVGEECSRSYSRSCSMNPLTTTKGNLILCLGC